MRNNIQKLIHTTIDDNIFYNVSLQVDKNDGKLISMKMKSNVPSQINEEKRKW